MGQCVEQDAAQDVTNARDGLYEGEGLGIVVRGRCAEKELEGAEPLVLLGEQLEVDGHGLLDSRGGKLLGDAFPIGFRGHLRANFWQGVLAVGILDRCQEFRAFAPQGRAASEQIAGRAPLGRRARGLGQHAAAEEGSNRVRGDLVILGLAAGNGFHRERVAQDKGHIFLGAEVGEPRPRAATFHGHDQAVPVRGKGLEEWFWRRLHVAMQQDFAIVSEDADVHTPGMPVDPAGKGGLSGGESP